MQPIHTPLFGALLLACAALLSACGGGSSSAPIVPAAPAAPVRPVGPVSSVTPEAVSQVLVQRMASLPSLRYYPELFSLAFGDAAITEARVQSALAAFERSIASFTASEDRGRALFMSPPGPGGGLGCAGCHAPPMFSLNANSLSNGLDTGETAVFKSPSLKNVARAGAFMHDGRFLTLAQVIEHYNAGVKSGPALDPRLSTPGGAPRVLNLSESDKQAPVDFLMTLNDDVLATDKRFMDPFMRASHG